MVLNFNSHDDLILLNLLNFEEKLQEIIFVVIYSFKSGKVFFSRSKHERYYPISSASHFVYSHFVHSHFIYSHFVYCPISFAPISSTVHCPISSIVPFRLLSHLLPFRLLMLIV